MVVCDVVLRGYVLKGYDMGDRIFSLVTSLLCNGYVVRVQRPTSELHGYDICDYENGDESEVSRCYNRIMSSEYPSLWVFRKDDWYLTEAEAVALIDLDTEEDSVTHYREYEIDKFIADRVKEAK